MLSRSLYIHIPWCIRKCPYCDFNSHKSPGKLPEEAYVAALVNDFKQDITRFPTTQIDTIFIGGGTPSLFSANAYDTLFEQLQQLVPFANNIEITLEANPGTIDQQRFKDYRSLGINRLSLGIQSFNSTHLNVLGRIHDGAQAQKAIEIARLAGFDNINVDIMHGLPQQSITQGLDDLRLAITHQPEHLSWYQLTIEPNTVFYKKTPMLPPEEETCQLEEEGLKLLEAHGFQRYEISAFCQSDRKSCHNLTYWLFGDYYGIGAGAHGKLTVEKKIYRTQKYRQPTDYLNSDKPYTTQVDCITAEDCIFEFMLNTTRLQQPIPKSLFTERTGLPFEKLAVQLIQAEQKGLIRIEPDYWQVTPFGRRYTNDLQALFLP